MNPSAVFFARGSFPPVSNTERQRQFRQRNPDYYRLRKARQRAASKAYLAQWRAIEAFKLKLLPPIKPVLMLPAPVQDPAMAAIDALAVSLASRSADEPFPLPSSTNHHADS